MLVNPYHIAHKNRDVLKEFAMEAKITNNNLPANQHDTDTSKLDNLYSLIEKLTSTIQEQTSTIQEQTSTIQEQTSTIHKIKPKKLKNRRIGSASSWIYSKKQIPSFQTAKNSLRP